MWIFFTAHPGQIDGLCFSNSLLSVYSAAFSLHWPSAVTPRGSWFLPHCFLFKSLSSFIFSLIFSSAHFLKHIHVDLMILHSLSSIFFCSFISFAPSGLLVSVARFIAFYSVSRPPASLCFVLLPLPLRFFLLLFFSLCSSRLSCVYTLHLSLSLDRLLSVFPSLFVILFVFPGPSSLFVPSSPVLSLPPLHRLPVCTGSRPRRAARVDKWIITPTTHVKPLRTALFLAATTTLLVSF